MIWALTSRLNRTKDSFTTIMLWCRKWLLQPHIRQRKLKKFGRISMSTADVDLKIGKLENEKNYAVYEKWKK